MKLSYRMSLIALAASAFAVAGAAAQADKPPPMNGPAHWVADREALLDAKLGGLRAGLRLNPDQEKLWGPFEAAVREAAQLRMRRMMSRMDRMRGAEGPGMMEPGMGMGEDEEGGPGSPVDRLEAMADRMTEGAAALKKIADTAKPLYASLDDNQKRLFGMLGREMMMLGHGHGGMMGWHEHDGMMGGPGTRRHDGVGSRPSRLGSSAPSRGRGGL